MAIPRPKIDMEAAVRIAEEFYDIVVDKKTFKEFVGYDDKNFYFKCDPDHAEKASVSQQYHANGYILKITNSVDSKNPSLLQAQNNVMDHLAAKDFACPRPIRNNQGGFQALADINQFTSIHQLLDAKEESVVEEEYCIVRLLTFLPGKTLAQVTPWTAEMLNQAGQFVAKIDVALKDFQDPVFSTTYNIWFMKNVLDVRKYLPDIRGSDRRELCAQILDEFETAVTPLIPQLDSGTIHGDFNEQNILVEKEQEAGNNNYRVCGVIDFGDTNEAAYVFELAVAVMYLMLKYPEMDPNLAGAHIIAGYSKHRDVTEEELSILPVIVACRFCQSLVIGEHKFADDPTNEYVLDTAKCGGWEVLQDFWSQPKQELIQKWKEIIDSYEK